MAELARYSPPDLKKIKALGLGPQSWQMRGLARTYGELLDHTNPGFIRRYESYPKAVVNVWRLAIDSRIHAFLIYPGVEEYEKPVGVATIIPEQFMTIRKDRDYVDNRSFTDIDYWVGTDLHSDAHREIGEILVQRATDARSIRPARPLLVSTAVGNAFPEGLDERNGFADVVHAATMTALYTDSFGVARQGAEVDVRIRESATS